MPVCIKDRIDWWSLRTKEETCELRNGFQYSGDNIFYYIDKSNICGFAIIKDGKIYTDYKKIESNDRKYIENQFKNEVNEFFKNHV